MTLFRSNRTISAFLYLILAVLVLVFFGLRWFQYGTGGKDISGQWPPIVNTCPDYLTYYERTGAGNTKVKSCIDLIGVSRNSALKKMPPTFPGIVPTEDAAHKYFFDLTGTQQELCQRCITNGLTWEGVSNGESCYSPTNPVLAAVDASGNLIQCTTSTA